VGQVSFSGIIPGGVAGLYDASKKGLSPFPLVHLLFTPKNIGTTNLSFADSKLLENDGSGTPVVHDSPSVSITIQKNPNGAVTQTPPPTTTVPNPNNSNPGSPVMPDRPDPLFWVVIFILVSSILIYKLLKYKV